MINEKINYSGFGNERIDKYLASKLSALTRTQIQLMIDDEQITVNEKPIKANYRLCHNDLIAINEKAPVLSDILPQNIPLEIIYEDNDIIVINKPIGMVVHPAAGNYENTLVNALLFHCQDLSSINGKIRAGIVHRLDKDTSGLIVACKNDKAHKKLSEQFASHTVKKIYYAICHGTFSHSSGTIDAPIGRNPNNRQQMSVIEKGKEAKTNFKVLKIFDHFSFVEVDLYTGRTHQIRVHFKYINHPLAGDKIYGPKNTDINRLMLHSGKLSFVHPVNNQLMVFESKLPKDFDDLLQKL